MDLGEVGQPGPWLSNARERSQGLGNSLVMWGAILGADYVIDTREKNVKLEIGDSKEQCQSKDAEATKRQVASYAEHVVWCE